MLRLIYTIFRNIFKLYMIPLMRYVAAHPQKYNEERRYRLVRRVCRYVTKAGRIHTNIHGLENIPKTGSYIICPNHQGKYDALAIINAHDTPCSLVMDYKRSQFLIVNEIMCLLQGKRLKRDDVRQAMTIIMEVTEELKNGKKYIIFPEGGYTKKKKNRLFPFKAGSFKCVQRSKAAIVPVVLYNTYKAFGRNSIRKTYNDVYFLKPIYHREFEGMKTSEIAELTRLRIAEKIAELEGKPLNDILVVSVNPNDLI